MKKFEPGNVLRALAALLSAAVLLCGCRAADDVSSVSEREKDLSGKTAEEIIEDMSLYSKLCQLFIVTQEEITGVGTVIQSGETSRAAIEKYPVGGIIYFAQNFISPEQTTDMIKGIQSFSEIPLFIAVDEEGGSVARLSNNPDMKLEKKPSMGNVESEESAYSLCRAIGEDIKALGFNLDFAPVADVNSNPDNPVIGDRAFSDNSEETAKYVAAAVRGFKESGVLCTLKHFPGHGDTEDDSHDGYTELKRSLNELRKIEFPPFKAGAEAGADFVMLGHISLPEITGNNIPATLSPDVVSLLREEIGFEGLILTDSLSMKAITDRYSAADAAVSAVKAGADVLLMPESLSEAVGGIAAAIERGEITEERINQSVFKILDKKIKCGII